MPHKLFIRTVAWPSDHGTWAFFLGPLVIGLAAGGTVTVPSTYLVVAALAGFLLRQPLTTLVKILSRRKPRRHLAAAVVWSITYLSIALAHVAGLAIRGFGFVLVLAVPGVAVFAWYLVLVARREERGQKGVEILGAGVLALSAPACYWIGIGYADGRGWLLWALCWILSAMSIVHVYARLEQRAVGVADLGSLRSPARRALGANSVLLVATVAAVWTADISPLTPVPFLVQWAETARSSFASVPPLRPTAIGLRQLVVSALVTALFIAVWQ